MGQRKTVLFGAACAVLVAGLVWAQSTVVVRDPTTATSLMRVYVEGDAEGTVRGPVCMGTDGTNIRALLTDSSGRLFVTSASGAPTNTRLQDGDGTGLADVFADGDARGTPKAPACMVDDGTNMQTMAGDTSGNLKVVGTVASGSAVGATAPIMCAGSDGTNVQRLSVDTGGRSQANVTDDTDVLGVASAGAAVETTGLMCMGTDGTNARSLSVDTAGRPQTNISDDTDVLGVASAGSAVETTGLMSMGTDGTNARSVSVDTSGRPQVNISDDTNVLAMSVTGSAVPANGILATGTDGTNSRALRTDTSGYSQVNISDDTDVALVDGSGNLMSSLGTRIAGEDITNDRLKVEINARTVSNPAVTTTVIASNGTTCAAVSGASCTQVYASTNWQTYRSLTITLDNTGANALTDCLIEWAPTDADATREIWDSTTFAGLASGTVKSLSIDGNSRRFLRIEGRSALGTTVDVYVTAAQ